MREHHPLIPGTSGIDLIADNLRPRYNVPTLGMSIHRTGMNCLAERTYRLVLFDLAVLVVQHLNLTSTVQLLAAKVRCAGIKSLL